LPKSDEISILVVDDEPAILDIFRAFLEREPGFVVETTPVSTEALELMDTRHFDVIVSDYSMPELDGIALLREARARGFRSLFVIVTGRRLAHIAMDALNSGADFYIQKGGDATKDFGRLAEFIRARVPEKRAEHEIAEWERFYQSVVECAPDLICRVLPDGSFTYVNESCLHLFNRPYDDMIRQNLFFRIPDDERSEVFARLRNLSAVKPDVLLEHGIETDSGKIPALQWLYHGFFSDLGALLEYQISGRTREGLVRIGEGGITGGASFASAAAAAPASSAASQGGDDYDWKGLADTVQSVENPVFAIDRSGSVIAWNRALEQLTGVEASQMVGRGRGEYAIPFYGKPTPMLIDHILPPHDSPMAGNLPGFSKAGDTYVGEAEHVVIRGKPMLLWGRGSPVYDERGSLIAAIELITVGEPPVETDGGGLERYLGGISSITLKVSGEGVGGAIAGAIGSSTGGYGVYATDQRIFVIRNPELDVGGVKGIRFGTFLMDELFGRTVDTGRRSIKELETLRVFEAWKKDIVSITLKKPVLLSGYVKFVVDRAEPFRVYIDHKKAFTHVEQLMVSFCPEKIAME
jgi:PAS domain S-box-containing protein